MRIFLAAKCQPDGEDLVELGGSGGMGVGTDELQGR